MYSATQCSRKGGIDMPDIQLELAKGNHSGEFPKGTAEMVKSFLVGAGLQSGIYKLVLGQAVRGSHVHVGRVEVVRYNNASVTITAQPKSNDSRRELLLNVPENEGGTIFKLLKSYEEGLTALNSSGAIEGAGVSKKKGCSYPEIINMLKDKDTVELILLALVTSMEQGATLPALEAVWAIKTQLDLPECPDEAVQEHILDELARRDLLVRYAIDDDAVGYKLSSKGEELLGSSQDAADLSDLPAIQAKLASCSEMATEYQAAREELKQSEAEMREAVEQKKQLQQQLNEATAAVAALEAKRAGFQKIVRNPEHLKALRLLKRISQLLRLG